jgi:SAM-dependent methyltransferase
MGFDEHALVYEQELRQGLRLSGEQPDWFARRRVDIVREYLDAVGRRVADILEFGCGTGNHVPFLGSAFAGARIVGVDVSRESLKVAQARHRAANVRFLTPAEFDEPGSVDLVYVNGVFHHIPPAEHAAWLSYFHRLLRPGGTAAIFDNNPFSLPARLVMGRIPFDRDAIMVNPYRFAALLVRCGFARPRLRFHFIFPGVLGFLRPIESWLDRWPIGAQFGQLTHPASPL